MSVGSPARERRAGLRFVGLLTAIATFAIFAFPVSAHTDPPGNNGTVKIHDDFEAEPIRRNEPHVCDFHVHAFGLDSAQQGDFEIQSWPPTGTKTKVYGNSYTANGDGEYISGEIVLPDGHYKLFFEGRDAAPPNGVIDAQNVKHKVFWVECGTVAGDDDDDDDEDEDEEKEEAEVDELGIEEEGETEKEEDWDE